MIKKNKWKRRKSENKSYLYLYNDFNLNTKRNSNLE